MPASELDWTSYNRGPIHQVFGTKRKADSGDKTIHNCDIQDPAQQHAKRMCQWSDNSQQLDAQQQPPPFTVQAQGPLAFTEDNFCNNNNNNSILIRPGALPPFGNNCGSMDTGHQECSVDAEMQQELQQAQYRQIAHPALSQVLSQQPPRVPSPWPSHQPCQPNQADSNVMDINGETFNPAATAAAEIESACSNMESDFVPDQQQYVRESPRRSPNSGDFCRNFCGVGENSPTSGRVRCYCKPSWEGMLDMKPYVSDVY